MTSNTKTITIDETTYNITFVVSSPRGDTIVKAHVECPRGDVKTIICFVNGLTRIVSYSRSGMDNHNEDLWREESAEIRESLLAAMID